MQRGPGARRTEASPGPDRRSRRHGPTERTTRKITTKTASNLGEKLAALELSEAEGQLLWSLLSDGATDDEVSGFAAHGPGDKRIMFETFRTQNLQRVLGPLPRAWQLEIEGYVVTQDLQD